MRLEHRRPAGVDPSVLCDSTTKEATQAQEIGRRVAAKLRARVLEGGSPPAGVTNAERLVVLAGLDVAAVVEAEVRSAQGTPPFGAVDMRHGYVEAVTIATALIESMGDHRSAEENRMLLELRSKFYDALGFTDPW